MGTERNNQQINEQKGKRRALTILGYVCIIVVLLAVLPVVLPPIFGYHTYLLGTDTTGNISKYGSVVYTKELEESSYKAGNLVAVDCTDANRTVNVYYVASNDTASASLLVEAGNATKYELVAGRVVAKTPFIGYLSQLCFSVIGIVVLVALFVAGLALMMYVNKISKEINQQLEDQKNK